MLKWWRKPKTPAYTCDHRGCGFTVNEWSHVFHGECNRCGKEVNLGTLFQILMQEQQAVVLKALEDRNNEQ